MAVIAGLPASRQATPSDRVAVFDAILNDEGGLPWPYLEAQLCQSYHCLPSELDGEDAARILQGTALLNLGDVVKRFKKDPAGLKPDEYNVIRDLVK